ncbi:MAG TPA: four helix bundle protein, partial [Gemmatimonadaceae bacterium]
MQDFRKLHVWQHAHKLRLMCYEIARQFPGDERYGLTSQLRRSAGSIAANIAESCGYRGGLDSARYLYIATGSCCETLDHLIVARDLGYLATEQLTSLEADLQSVRRMLKALIDRMRSGGERSLEPSAERPKPRA